MKISPKSNFLRPVLNKKFPEKNGYSIGSIEIEDLQVKEHNKNNKNYIDIIFVPKLEQPDIENLIDKEFASCFLLIECYETNKRFCEKVHINQSNAITLEINDFKGDVDFHIFISSIQDIKNYSPNTVDDIYKINGKFDPIDVDTGELLAISEKQYISINPKYLDVKIFRIVEDDKLVDLESYIDLNRSTARIYVSPTFFENYSKFKQLQPQNRGYKILDFSLFLSFFVFTLSQMYPRGLAEKDNFEEAISGFKGLTWYVAITQQVNILINEKTISVDDDIYKIAQHLCENPFKNLTYDFLENKSYET